MEQLSVNNEVYKKIRKSLTVGSDTTRAGSEDIEKTLKKHSELLNLRGNELLKEFETSWAGNDFSQAKSLNELSGSISDVRKLEDGDKKAALQAFLGIAYRVITNDDKMGVTRKGWNELTNRLLDSESEILGEEYPKTELSRIKAGDFNNLAIDGLAQNMGEDFEKYKKVAWLLTK